MRRTAKRPMGSSTAIWSPRCAAPIRSPAYEKDRHHARAPLSSGSKLLNSGSSPRTVFLRPAGLNYAEHHPSRRPNKRGGSPENCRKLRISAYRANNALIAAWRGRIVISRRTRPSASNIEAELVAGDRPQVRRKPVRRARRLFLAGPRLDDRQTI